MDKYNLVGFLVFCVKVSIPYFIGSYFTYLGLKNKFELKEKLLQAEIDYMGARLAYMMDVAADRVARDFNMPKPIWAMVPEQD